MNERIQQLYTQALEYADSVVPAERRYNDIYYAIVSGKHAELIVRECADLFDKNETDIRIPEYQIHDSIMIHFGLY
jgi:hypothetical protein